MADGTVIGDGELLEQDGANGTIVLFPEEGIVNVTVGEDRTRHDTYYEESLTIFPDGFVFFIGGYSHQTLSVSFDHYGRLPDEAYTVGDPANAIHYDKHWWAVD